MFAQNFTTPLNVAKSAVITTVNYWPSALQTEPQYQHLIDLTLTIETAAHGQQQARVMAVVASPFYGETGMMAYVTNLAGQPFFTDYIPLETVLAAAGESEGGESAPSLDCPECKQPLTECDCTPSWLDDPEFPDYQQVEVMGFLIPAQLFDIHAQ